MIKAVFLDRDGIINKRPKHPELKDKNGKICKDALSLEEYKTCIYPNIEGTINEIKTLGYQIIVISNQGAIAKGFYSKKVLEQIKNYLKLEFGLKHQYYCLHHPSYTGSCDCRKPKPGLILKAAKDFGIDLEKSYMVGDSDIDIQAGKAAGCKTIKIKPGHLKDAIKIISTEV